MVGHVKMREKDEKSLPLEERLKIIDDEIRKFHKSSLAKGYTPSEIEKSAEPLLGHMRRAHRKRWLMFFCKVALCVALLAALWRYDPTYRMICSYTRLAAIQVSIRLSVAYNYKVYCMLALDAVIWVSPYGRNPNNGI